MVCVRIFVCCVLSLGSVKAQEFLNTQRREITVIDQSQFIAAIGDNITISLAGNITFTSKSDDNSYIEGYTTGIHIENVTGLSIRGTGFEINGGGSWTSSFAGNAEAGARCLYIKNAIVEIEDLVVSQCGLFTSSYDVSYA